MTPKLRRFLDEVRPSTPCLVVDLDVVEANYRALATALDGVEIFYAIKANPAPEILTRLVALGSSFDAASVPEIEQVLAAGAGPARISYGSTIKKEADIARAFELGVRLFAFDSEAELSKIARAAPGARVFCRILTNGEGADWPLSRKFGCTPKMAKDLLARAATLDVVPWGVSFHVGSQQKNPKAWDSALAEAASLFRELEAIGVELGMVNLGGGFPTPYRSDVPEIGAYAHEIMEAVRRHFGNRLPFLIAEPGRGLVGNAGVIQTEVVLIAEKGDADGRRWVYLDIGKFGGLAETMDEAIQYPIHSHRKGAPVPVILAGPTCDSADVLYERAPYTLPADLAIGDRLEIEATGAYTTTYSTVGFNGFEPLRSYYI
ncbi:type III PLP-dependent enzyme [Benzoatithermus flavus]|uniref:ornithine decarboxylase n=1 Tax=Benzoatithermus flavus TaxID=3108223 RepID=A0ABU8Y1B8_9PROT